MSHLDALKAEIISDGRISSRHVKQIRALIFTDAIVDRRAAIDLFEINDAIGHGGTADWTRLFVDGIGRHVLEDPDSPGKIDEDEAEFLRASILRDGQIDDAERALLTHLRLKADVIHERLLDVMGELGI